MPNKLEAHEAAWLAAAIDGEGTITARKASRRDRTQTVVIPLICVANCNHEFLEKVKTLIGKIVGETKAYQSGPGVNYPIYRVEIVSQKKCQPVLEEILPWLIVKRRRAKALLAWFNDRAKVRKKRPGRGGGTPYGEETDKLFRVLQSDRLDREVEDGI